MLLNTPAIEYSTAAEPFVYAEPETASDLTIKTEINYEANIVTVSGNVTGPASFVTMYAKAPDNRVEYSGSTAVENGSYEIKFKLTEPVNNTIYKVILKAEGMSISIPFSFEYKKRVFKKRTAGIEYEQIYSDLPDIESPVLYDVEVEVLNFTKGIYRLTIADDDFSIDPRGSAFFFWSTTEGEFSEISPDYRSVVFSADAGTGPGNVRINIGLGDNLGRVNRKTILLKGNDFDGGF